MNNEWRGRDQEAFLAKLREALAQGAQPEVQLPYWLDECENLMPPSRSKCLARITLFGALSGVLLGIALPVLTVFAWPLATGGKSLISIPAFIIIAFELCILFGSLASFSAFLWLARLPAVGEILSGREWSDDFVIRFRGAGK